MIPTARVFQQGLGAVGADDLNSFIQNVANVAQLRTMTGVSGMVVYMDGSSSPGDGGQVNYYWSAAATAPDNGVTVICPNGVAGNGAWLILPAVFDPYVPNSGGGDDTVALQNALNEGGVIFLSANTYNYTSLTVTKPCRIVGTNQTEGTPGTYLKSTIMGSSDRIVIGNQIAQLSGVEFEHINFTAPNATGGSILSFINCSDCAVRDFQMTSLNLAAVGIKMTQVNTIRIYDGRIVNPTQAGIYAFGGDGARSDVIQVINLIVSGESTIGTTYLPAGIELDGWVNTVNGVGWNFVTCGRGLYRHNAIGTSMRAEFIMVHDMEVDYPYYEGVRMEYGDSSYFVNCYFHGSQTTYNVYLGTSTPNSIDNTSIIGGQVTSAFKAGIYDNSRYLRVVGVEISFNGQSASNTYPGVELGPASLGAIISGNHIGMRSGFDAAWQNYGVICDSGAINYTIIGNNLFGNVTGPLLDNNVVSNSSGIISPNIGMQNENSLAVIIPTTGFTIDLGTAVGAYNVRTLALYPVGTLAAGTVVLDPGAFDGQQVTVFSSQVITALTVSPGAGQTVENVPTTVALDGSFTMQYAGVSTTWYRVG